MRAAPLFVVVFALMMVVALLPAARADGPLLVRRGLVLGMGGPNDFDGMQAGYPSVLMDQGVYKMWYFGTDFSWLTQIGYATSTDGRNWTKYGVVLSPSLPEEGHDIAYPSVVRTDSGYWMWYDGFDGVTYRVFAASSSDGRAWTKHGVVLDVGAPGSQDSLYVAYPSVRVVHGMFYMWYTGINGTTPPNAGIMLATSTDGLNWTRQGVVLPRGSTGSLDGFNLFTCSVVDQDDQFRMLYMGQSNQSDTRLLYATSSDGVHWSKLGAALSPDPPAERTVGHPNIVVLPDGTWDVYYAVRNDGSDIQIFLATGSVGGEQATVLGLPTLFFVFLFAVVAIATAVILVILFSLRGESRRHPHR